MSAGRGTPRIPALGGDPNFFSDGVIQVTPGPWSYVRTFSDDDTKTLTASYSAYTFETGQFRIRIPLGATRLAVVGLYTPGEANGQLGLQVKWETGGGDLAYALLEKGTVALSPSQDPLVAEIDSYGVSVVSPPATVTDLARYVIPFVVPPLPSMAGVLDSEDERQALAFRIFVREASGLATPGTFFLEKIVAQSFGEAQPTAVR